MAKATPTLSPTIEPSRLGEAKANLAALRFRMAVITRAGQLARKSLKEEIRARGERPQDYTC
jgi:hypothetical protein